MTKGEVMPVAYELLSRRGLFKIAGAGLCLAALPSGAHAGEAGVEGEAFGIYLRLMPDGAVQLLTPNAEMGQGTYDALSKLVAEELDADWARVSIGLSGFHPGMVNPRLGQQVTGNSEAVRGYCTILRRAGATARAMLVQAASLRWGVPAARLRTESGHVLNDMAEARFSYAELVSDAALLPVPEVVPLKDESEFRLLGRDLPRKEVPDKVRGRAIYGLDIKLPDMLVAAMAMPAAAWGSFRAVGMEAALAVPGVQAVVPVRGGQAVVAGDWWTAQKAAALISFEAEGELLSQAAIDQALAAALDDDNAPGAAFTPYGTPLPARDESRVLVADAMAGAVKRVRMDADVPYLAHATLEPMNCTGQLKDGALTVWAPNQSPEDSAKLAARLTGLPLEKIDFRRTFMGGGFGRRWNNDYVQQAVETVMGLPPALQGRPVKLVWSRTQDGQHDFYRSASRARTEVGLDAGGRICAWRTKVVGQSLMLAWREGATPQMRDGSLIKELPYGVPVVHLETAPVSLPVPVGFWRSVAHMPNIFFQEIMMDTLAAEVGADPLEFRLAHLAEDPRSRAVLETLAGMMGWAGRARAPRGVGHGLALSNGYGSWCAVGARVKLAGGQLVVERLWGVMDCGLALEPENVRRQVEGAMVFGLGAALDGRVSFENGVASPLGLTDVGMSSPAGVPPIEVKLIRGGDAMGGAGEVGVPGVAPALCNAILAAGGPAIRSLPISAAGLTVVV
jgi:CO/xanthine dehydrogenase Mo-binding subunit